MESSKKFKIFIILFLVLTNIGCDQVSKKVVRENLKYHDRIEVGMEQLILIKVENDGAMLGLGQNLSPLLKKILLQGLPLIFLTSMLGYILFKSGLDIMFVIGCTFIIGGGIGNLIDRVLYGSVTDFMLIDLGFVKTGIFNAADVSVMIGTGIILLQLLMEDKE